MAEASAQRVGPLEPAAATAAAAPLMGARGVTHHIAIGTPMHWGLCSDVYNDSVMRLDRALRKDGSKLSIIPVGNESLVQRARNTIAWHFLERKDATHLLFVDSDTGFRVEDVARMQAAGKPVIVGPCPLKAINWNRVAAAVKAGVVPDDLHRHTGFFNVVRLPGETRICADEPFEIKWGGSGFMLIERGVLQQLSSVTPDYANRMPGKAMPPGVRVKNFFPVEIEEDDLLSEDFGFCAAWRRIGGTVWAAPWCEIDHAGTYVFTGRYRDWIKSQQAVPT